MVNAPYRVQHSQEQIEFQQESWDDPWVLSALREHNAISLTAGAAKLSRQVSATNKSARSLRVSTRLDSTCPPDR
jgi:hypothetical protein